MGYMAFVLDNDSRKKLLENLPPAFCDVIAHHVTIRFGVKRPTFFADPQLTVQVIGYGIGIKEFVDAAVVTVNGKTHSPDNRLYHITLSLDRSKGAKPKDSNVMLFKNGYHTMFPPFEVTGTFEYCD